MIIKFLAALLFMLPSFAYSDSASSSEKGRLTGSLGFGAMTIDRYYEMCYSNGTRTNVNLNGINKLIKDKWGFTYTETADRQQKLTGRNYRNEADVLVRAMIEKYGGCNTAGMDKWVNYFRDLHESNLKEFHALR